MNENENKSIPEDNSDITNRSNGSEDAKAFGFEWTDGENGTAEGHDVNAPEENDQPNPDTEAEKEASKPESVDADVSRPNASASSVQNPQKPSTLLKLSCILSGTAMLLLLVFAIGVFSGLFPSKLGGSVFSSVSSLGETDPDSSASPDLIEEVMTSVVIVQSRNLTGISTGTGIIISNDGYIITNYHVIENGGDDVTVALFGDDAAIPAAVVGYKETDDIAVLKIERAGLRPATFADSSSVRYGEKVYAIGTPEGAEFGWSVTQGIVSCPDRQLMMYDSEGILEKKMRVIQTDASVNHGNSGGPLVNVRGEVVGIVTLKLSSSSGMGFALPSDGVLIDVEAILRYGNADNVDSGISSKRPLIGITGVGVTGNTFYENIEENGQTSIKVVDEAYAKENADKTFYAEITGVYVSATSKGLDAASKVLPGDIITEINGNSVTNIYEVMDIINRYDGGDKVTIKYYRNGNYFTVDITLGTQS